MLFTSLVVGIVSLYGIFFWAWLCLVWRQICTKICISEIFWIFLVFTILEKNNYSPAILFDRPDLIQDCGASKLKQVYVM